MESMSFVFVSIKTIPRYYVERDMFHNEWARVNCVKGNEGSELIDTVKLIQ